MLPIRRLYFVVIAFLIIVVSAAILLAEIIPFLVYYIATGKYFGLSEKFQSLTFEYIEKKIDEAAK
jgi:hypothetical protein